MKTVGIICEYNPLHRGHQKQLDTVRSLKGSDCGIVCLMSGNYVQRGAPAIIDKSLRAKAAILSGADLVLELPVTAALSSAEGFAAKGVAILGSFCDKLCFGAETADAEALLSTAESLLSDNFPPALRAELDKGKSFPAARAAALETMGLNSDTLSSPNNILAVEYCKAILSQGCAMKPLPIHRAGGYHDETVDAENPSATAVRKLMINQKNCRCEPVTDITGVAIPPNNQEIPTPVCELARNDTVICDWKSCIPTAAREIFDGAALHTLAAGERAVLARLRTMTDAEFEALPYSSEGLWRKLMHAARREATLEEVATAVKSKRYTRTRIDRMILCAFLGLTSEDLFTPPPYARVLAFNDKGREILKKARQTGAFPNVGEKIDHPYQAIEDRTDALYGLFAVNAPESPKPKPRVFYLR